MIDFLRAVAPLIPPGPRRRLRVSAFGSIVLVALDTIGVLLVLPALQLVTTADDVALTGAAELAADVTGVSDRGSLAALLAVSVLGCFLAKAVLAVALLRSTVNACAEVDVAVTKRVLLAYLTAPITFHLGRNTADLQRTVHESTRRVFTEALAAIVPAMADRVILVVLGLGLFVLAPLESLAGALVIGVLVVAYRRNARRRAASASGAMAEQARAAFLHVHQSLASIREIKVTGTEAVFVDEVTNSRRAFAGHQAVLSVTEQLPRYLLEIALVLGAAAVTAVALLHRPDEAFAVVGLFAAAGFRLRPSLNRSINAAGKADIARPYLGQLVADLEAAESVHESAVDTEPFPAAVDSIRLRSVRYRYPNAATDALHDVNLDLPIGSAVGVVGGSGAGKSTLVLLLLGLLTPTEGSVEISGRSLADVRVGWRQRLGYVPQDVALLDASIRENVAFGAPADDDRLWQALDRAELGEFVRSLPAGLDTEVGERGAALSGGQRQRLGLARALHADPDLLLLDEATSALDNETERRVIATLQEHRGRSTTVVVAHRLSTVRWVELIVVLAAGRVVAVGSYDELLADSTDFQTLVAAVAD